MFVGADIRYFRQYEGLPLNSFAGRALYVGLTFYADLGPHALVSAEWATQMWGAVSKGSATLDLADFNRHQALLRFAVMF
jgi:hypothetical protein